MLEQHLPEDYSEPQTGDKPWFFDVFPCRPAPYPGECLSGYLLRLQEANGFATFSGLVRDLFPMWGKNSKILLLHWEYPLDNWGRIPLRTQLSTTYLKRLTVIPWIEKFQSTPNLMEPNFLGNFSLRNVVTSTLQVCPLCLQEQPFIRLMWRLTSVQACLHHGCLLQNQCPKCKTQLTMVGPKHRHLHCSICGMDLRMLPIVTAPDDILMKQNIQQANLQFLLFSDVALVRPSDPGSEDLLKTIGLKFRYLRRQKNLSVIEIAHQLGVPSWEINYLELGKHALLQFYLAYLEKLSISWLDFAALKLPYDFLQARKQPQYKYMNLRLCPTPNCPNHYPPPNTRVGIASDMPDRRLVSFHCKDCGRYFTRDYSGSLVTSSHRELPNPPYKPSCLLKSVEEVTRLKELGLCGQSDYKIACIMGWARTTVTNYWIALDLREQVLKAQAQRRMQEKQDRCLRLCSRVEAVLNFLISQEEEITLNHGGGRDAQDTEVPQYRWGDGRR